jgi:D-alanine transaminase
MRTVYLNGKFLPVDQAHVSVLDRGFLFGDGIYEVIPVYNKIPFRLKQHLQRLRNSLQAIRLDASESDKDWENIFVELIDRNLKSYGENQAIYVQVTRGFAPERLHLFPTELQPTIFAQTTALKTLSLEELNRGLEAITLPDPRWQNCHIKSIALLPNILLYQQAKEAGAHEAILIRDGYAVEAATSNLFIIQKGIITTPPLSNHLLGGITRDFILELAQTHNLPCQENPVRESELRAADEIWVTSSTKEIYPIIKLDKQMVGSGKPGALWQQMIRHYHNYIKKKS